MSPKALRGAAHVRSSAYFCPYQGHLPFGPNCALADVGADGALIQSSTQDVYNARAMLARVLGMPAKKVRVQYYEGSGTFGRSCYEDAAQAAAIMSQAVGRPVRVQYMRWDEHGWDNYGPAHLAEVRAGVDADGKLVAYEYHGWQHGWTVTSTIQDIALQKPGVERTSGSASITVNPMSTGSMYVVPNRRVISHAVPMEGYLRGRGAALAARSLVRVCFRADHRRARLRLEDGPARIPAQEHRRQALARRARSSRQGRRLEAAGDGVVAVERRGRARPRHRARHAPRSYGAAVADIEVNKRTGAIVATHLYGALDCGLAVNPALVETQIIGQMIQSVSRVLKEEVLFDKRGVTSLDWEIYPVLRFAEHPAVTPVVVQRLDEPRPAPARR